MDLVAEQLRACMPRCPQDKVDLYLPHLNAAMREFGVDTPARVAAFLAQIGHESLSLTRMEEQPWTEWRCDCGKWRGPERALRAAGGSCPSCRRGEHLYPFRYPDCYEGRRDLGNTQPGDGVRFRGRGVIQLTGRANYAAASRALFPGEGETDPREGYAPVLIQRPTRAAEPDVAFRVAGWFWAGRGLNELADLVQEAVTVESKRRRVDDLTRKVNGGLNGADDRWARYLRCCQALGVGASP